MMCGGATNCVAQVGDELGKALGDGDERLVHHRPIISFLLLLVYMLLECMACTFTLSCSWRVQDGVNKLIDGGC